MAEKASRDGIEQPSRRQSFRKTLAEAALPHEYLEALEEKRRQLDDSIHRYIAAKERDYKAFEKELRQQHKHEQDRGETSGRLRRTSDESTQDLTDVSQVQGRHQSAVDALLAAGMRKDQLGQSVAVAIVDGDTPGATILEARPHRSISRMVDRKATSGRDRDFVGVFTPAFLPALVERKDSKSPQQDTPERAASATELHESSKDQGETNGVQRAHSDSVVQAQAKRPVELQLSTRTSSSSGSSLDARLTSALKSPTYKPRNKSVSIAIGDSVVKPSDNVPVELSSHNSTPSHSRTRSPSTVPDDQEVTKALESIREVQQQATDHQDLALASSTSSVSPPSKTSPPSTDGRLAQPSTSQGSPSVVSQPPTRSMASSGPTSHRRLDPDGDLFDLQDEEEDLAPGPDPAADSMLEEDNDVVGRVAYDTGDTDDETSGEDADRMPDSGSDTHAEHIEDLSSSVPFSHQPTNPGFRRPSVSRDPIYAGADYGRAEHDAVTNEVYGSSYNRPNKSSFTAGSLGESFMARNAEMIRGRATQEEVRS